MFLLVLTDPEFNSTDTLSEATEMEYLRKVLFEYMMGRETKVCSLNQTIQSHHIAMITDVGESFCLVF